jgi:hypothetical protein
VAALRLGRGRGDRVTEARGGRSDSRHTQQGERFPGLRDGGGGTAFCSKGCSRCTTSYSTHPLLILEAAGVGLTLVT